MTTTLLLADDHLLFRQGLALLAREQRDWKVVAEASDGEEAVRLAEHWKPKIAVLDVEMPRMNGVEAAQQIKRLSPGTRIVALSMYADTYYQERMFEAGASAYVLKNEAMGDLVRAIRAVLAGERFVSPAAERQISAVNRSSAEVDKGVLSQRELEVLRLLAAGIRTRDIAEALSISENTVETYRSRIMLKLRIRNLPGLVKFAIRAGIVSPQH